MVEVKALSIPGVKLITSRKFGDERGFFSEVFNKQAFAEAGVSMDVIQDNHSFSAQIGTVRGLHFQTQPFDQDKLVRVSRGSILDIAVDVRGGSPTYGQHVSAVLSRENWSQLYVPSGFAHGFCTLEEDTEVIYKVTNPYSPEHDKGIFWNDPDLKIDWPTNERDATVSAKDKVHPLLRDINPPF